MKSVWEEEERWGDELLVGGKDWMVLNVVEFYGSELEI